MGLRKLLSVRIAEHVNKIDISSLGRIESLVAGKLDIHGASVTVEIDHVNIIDESGELMKRLDDTEVAEEVFEAEFGETKETEG
jgi:hypothetical protein